MKAVKQIFRWLLKNDYKSIDEYITIKNGEKIISPNKILTDLEQVAVATTKNTNKNFVKLILKNEDVLYTEMTLLEFLALINNDNFRIVNKSVVLDLSLVKQRLNDIYLIYSQVPYKIGSVYLPMINKYFKDKYNLDE